MGKKGIKQHDLRDCGAACLATVLLRHGAKVPLVTVREMMKVDKNGASMYAITQTAQKLHLHAEALSGNFEEFQDAVNKGEIRLPAIAHVIADGTLAHYVVVEQLKARKVTVFDPAKGRCTYTPEDFNARWTGYLIAFSKTDSFRPVNLKKGTFRKFYQIVFVQKSLFALVLGFSLLLAGISIISSLVYQQVIDRFVLGQSFGAGSNVLFFSSVMQQLNRIAGNMDKLFLALLAIYLLQFALYLARGFFIAKISRKSGEMLMYNYFSHMLRLPVRFFHDRETGELLSRFQVYWRNSGYHFRRQYLHYSGFCHDGNGSSCPGIFESAAFSAGCAAGKYLRSGGACLAKADCIGEQSGDGKRCAADIGLKRIH